MTVLEFWGCALIAFGPAISMFCLTVAHDPVKVILLIASSFFWLMSFFVVAIVWSIISTFCDYLIVGALLGVVSQEGFRYLFHIITKKAQIYLAKIIASGELTGSGPPVGASIRSQEIQLNNSDSLKMSQDRIPLSYVSGLGFGLMNGAFSLMNVLTDYIGPGTVGLKGDSYYFLLVSSLTALAFILLNVSWSILMSESIEKSDRKLASVVLITHLAATTITFVNRHHLQLVSIMTVYGLAIFCGFGAFKAAGLQPSQLMARRASSTNSNRDH